VHHQTRELGPAVCNREKIVEGRIAKVAKEAALMVGPQPHCAWQLLSCVLYVV
jgi:hypothetical protein